MIMALKKSASLTAINSDTGITGDWVTSDQTLLFSGTESNVSMLVVWMSGGIYGAGVPVGVATISGKSWSFDFRSFPFADGSYTITLTDGLLPGATTLS